MTRHGRASALAILLALAGAGGGARAYSVSLAGGTNGPIVRWQKSSVPYYLHPDCSVDLPAPLCLDELRASFDQWTEAGCASLDFVEAGTSANKKLLSNGWSGNGKSELAWIEDNQWIWGKYTLGVTSPLFFSDGSISEADIAFNGLHHEWKTSGESYSTDVMNVAVHEIGHFFGLQHALGGYDPSNPPTMAPTADPFMKSRTPEADDLDGFCFLYPKGSWSCAKDGDCPLVVDDDAAGNEYYVGQITCQAGLCGGVSNQVPEGDATMGQTCAATYDCVEPLFCQPMTGSAGVCASDCSTASPSCPAGFECVPYQGSPGKGVCLEEEEGPPGGTKALGEPCDSSFECASQLCIIEQGGTFCRQPCTSGSPCPAGEGCAPIPGAGYGACIEEEPPPPKKGLGEPCEGGSDCQSDLCAGDGLSYTCVAPCSPGAPCPDGFACFGLSGGGGACFAVESKPVGAECEGSFECTSDRCVSFDGDFFFCTDVCADSSGCPCGLECVETVSSGFLCAPGEKIACVPDGEPCLDSSECSGGKCTADAVCARVCSIFQGASGCPAGQGCQADVPGEPEGLCVPAGATSEGKPCASDLDCKSLFCHGGVCTEPCNPVGPDACPIGLACTGVFGVVGICTEPPPQEPEPVPTPEAAAGEPAGDAPEPAAPEPGAGGADPEPSPAGGPGAPSPDGEEEPEDGDDDGGGLLGCAASGLPMPAPDLAVVFAAVLLLLRVARSRRRGEAG